MKIPLFLVFICATVTAILARSLEYRSNLAQRKAKPLNNGERLMKGLPPARPRKLYTPDKAGAAPRPRTSPGFDHVICTSTDLNHYDKAGCCASIRYSDDRMTFIGSGCGTPIAVDTVFDCPQTYTSLCCSGEYTTDDSGTIRGCVAIAGSLNGI